MILSSLLLLVTYAVAGTQERVVVQAALDASHKASGELETTAEGVRLAFDQGWIEFELDVPVAGRYRCELVTTEGPRNGSVAWVEDYVDNPDGRTYDITAPMALPAGGGRASKDGSPLDAKKHRVRLHHAGGPTTIAALRFTLLRRHQLTPATLQQRTGGDEWTLVWSDEFDGEGPPDPMKWTHDFGNWGWGNRELQFYTDRDATNARQENGKLVIEARKDSQGEGWTSARLTTRGKISFLFGRIEFRAKLPAADGMWAAGWLLGDAYRDELSWPYCGEIDVLEGVGREIDDETGAGLNHGSCHTRAYYFKQGNHISETIAVEKMSDRFHVYAVEWTHEAVKIELDGHHYYTYDKTANELEWPFNSPQNLILNLAVGGGMGQAVDPEVNSAEFVIDWVRVYGQS